jgi:hypothetical protein
MPVGALTTAGARAGWLRSSLTANIPVGELTTAGFFAVPRWRSCSIQCRPCASSFSTSTRMPGRLKRFARSANVSTTGPTPVIRCSPLASAILNFTICPIAFGDFVAMNSDFPSQ